MTPQPPRLTLLWCITVALLVVVALVASHQIPVMLYKLSLVSLAGVAGYWLDRWLFPYARPHELMPARGMGKDRHRVIEAGDANGYVRYGECWLAAAAMIRRAVIVAAAMIGVTLGL